MPLKNLRPITPGTRNAVRPSFEEITTTKPEKSLTSRKQNHAGRNNRGRVTAQGRGGGPRRMYRQVDFKRLKDGVPARVKSIEYDPNRTTRIALIAYVDGEKSYILAPVGLSVGDVVQSGSGAEISRGNALPLQNIPTGTVVHNLELTPGPGRTVGARCRHRERRCCPARASTCSFVLPSGQRCDAYCCYVVGRASGSSQTRTTRMKAWGKQGLPDIWAAVPKYSGVAKNPGRPPSRRRRGPFTHWHARSRSHRLASQPWDHKTRNPKKASSKFIVRRGQEALECPVPSRRDRTFIPSW